MKKFPLFAQAIGLALALGALPAAHGAATLYWSLDGGATQSCADQDVCDQDTDVGVVEIDGQFGTYDVTVIAGLSKPEVTGDPLMDLGFIITSESSDDHTFAFAFSDTDFAVGGSLTADIGGTINGAGNELAAAAFCDPSNVLLGFDTLIADLGPFGAGAFSASGGPASCTTPYSATQLVLLDTTDTGVISGDFSITRVPEPGTLALLGLGLAGFAAFRRRRQK